MTQHQENSENNKAKLSLVQEAFSYWIDATQKSILFMDAMRKRGNVYLEHLKAGQPPVLTFDYEIIMDGKNLEVPTNYKLARIIPPKNVEINNDSRPVVIIDPRAGHGPGIGGSKRDSEIGMALRAGHPVYFILFETNPIANQNIPDIEKAEIAFIEEVVRRHPNSRKPAVIGNCQAGWALVMLSADKPGTTGPIVLNGSPLSYWAGIKGKDTMRYLGGLLGGVWLNAFLSDIGNGLFDGSNLVMNFELNNPGNTFWKKQYNLYSKIDSEEKRYLDFEKWWNGYFNLTKQEILFIVRNLFVGNRLEKGSVRLDKDKTLNLKDIQDPIVIFCSDGDDITPPQQALNWIIHVWGSVEEIKARQQVIVYMLHKDIGHLGIFVSGKIAQKEHKEMIGSYDMIEYLPAGLYEMLIEEETTQTNSEDGLKNYSVRFEEREMEDILALDDGMTEEEEQFPLVPAVSSQNLKIYETLIGPWVRAFSNEFTAEFLRQIHPMRKSRYIFSDLNPFMQGFKFFGKIIKENRQKASPDNMFLKLEGAFSDSITKNLELLGDLSSTISNNLFHLVYENESLMVKLFPNAKPEKPTPKEILESRKKAKEQERKDRAKWLKLMTKGGFVEGLIRMLIAISAIDQSLSRDEFIRFQKITREHEKLKDIPVSEFRKIAREQGRILQINREQALQSLTILLPNVADRQEAYKIASIVFSGSVNQTTQKLIDILSENKKLLDEKDSKQDSKQDSKKTEKN